MSGTCTDRVVVITGAGRGLGREYASAVAREGARVVVNDLGGDRDGGGSADVQPAQAVAAEIGARGGEAIVDAGDVADEHQGRQLIDRTVELFGRVNVLVNNAGSCAIGCSPT